MSPLINAVVVPPFKQGDNLDVFKSKMTLKLNLFLTTVDIDNDNAKKLAQAQLILANLDEAVYCRSMPLHSSLNSPTAVWEWLQANYGQRKEDKVYELTKEFTNFRQRFNETPLDYHLRFCNLLARFTIEGIDKLTQDTCQVLLIHHQGLSEGSFKERLVDYVHKNDWKEYDRVVRSHAQISGSTKSFPSKFNGYTAKSQKKFGQEKFNKYKNKANVDDKKTKAIQGCKFHGPEASHTTEECRVLKAQSQKSSHSNDKFNQKKDNKKNYKKGNNRRGHAYKTSANEDSDDSEESSNEQNSSKKDIEPSVLFTASSATVKQAHNLSATKKDYLLDRKILILDCAASPTTVSMGFLKKHNIKYDIIARHDPPVRISTAKGILMSYFDARIFITYNRITYALHTMVMDTVVVTPLLFGSTSLRLGQCVMDYKTNLMRVAAYNNAIIEWSYDQKQRLWYLPLHQPGKTSNSVQLLTTAEHISSDVFLGHSAHAEPVPFRGDHRAFTAIIVADPENPINTKSHTTVNEAAALIMTRQQKKLEAINNQHNLKPQEIVKQSNKKIHTKSKAQAMPLDNNENLKDIPVLESDSECEVNKISKNKTNLKNDEDLQDLPTLVSDSEDESDLISQQKRAKYANKSADINSKKTNSAKYVLTADGTELFLPEDVLLNAAKDAHEALAHAGPRPTYALLKKDIRGVNVQAAVDYICKSCISCAYNKPPNRGEASLGALKAKHPNETVAVDLVQYDQSYEGHTHVLTMQCHKTNYLAAYPVSNKEASEVQKAFNLSWITPFGFPTNVHRDGGTEFKSDFSDYLTNNGVNIITTPVAHPQSNGRLERKHRELHQALRHLLQKRQLSTDKWIDVLQAAVQQLNARPLESLNFISSYELMFGRSPNVPALLRLRKYLGNLAQEKQLERLNQSENLRKIQMQKELPKFKAGERVLF